VPKVDMNNVIRDLRDSIALLEKREAHLQKQVEQFRMEAVKKHKAKDKRGALSYLKRMKLAEKEIGNIFGKKDALWMQTTALETATSNKATLESLKKGTFALKATISESALEEVGEVMDDLNEHLALGEEIDNALAQPIGSQLDEAQLLAELEVLEIDTEVVFLESPIVPTKIHGTVQEELTTEESALAALQEEMGLA